MTLEEAQEQLLQLREELEGVKTERDVLSQDNEKLKSELDDVRTLNQTYFNKLTAQYLPQEEEAEEPPAPTCEEFALSLKV